MITYLKNYFIPINKKFIKYSFLAKSLHWSFVFIFIYGIYKQVDDINQLNDISLLRFEMIFASIFLLLLVLRFIYMTKTQVSSIPEHTHKIQKIASKVVHLGMYVSMSLIALTGLIIGALYYFGLKEEFIVESFLEIHGICVLACYWLIGLHLLGAIYHRFKKDGVWNSMVPFLKEKK